MFDLRYHVASLAAVFLALIIGIVVGVGISSGGFVKKGERKLLTDQIADLRNRLSAANARVRSGAVGSSSTRTSSLSAAR